MTDDILRILGQIEGKIDGINNRLDVTNGRIQKGEDKDDELEKKIDSLELVNAENKGSLKTAGAVGGFVATLSYFILGKLWK